MEEKRNNISLEDINNCSSLTPNDRKIAELYFIENKSLEEIVDEFEKEGSIQVGSVQRVNQYIQRVERKIASYKSQKDISYDTVYREIAKKALMSWNGLSEEEATKVVMESSNDELESQIYAQGSIDYALEGIKDWGNELWHKKLNSSTITMINDEDMEKIKFAIMNSSKTSRAFREFKDKKLWPGYDYDGKLETDLALAVLSHIHDGWVKDNQKKFMSRDKKYQHMPIELIGWKEVKSDLLFLRPILESMGIMPSEEELEKAYDERVKDFFKSNGITDLGQLKDKIAEGSDFYPALEGQDDILKALSDPEFILSIVIPSIEEKGIGADENAMKRVEQWKEESSRLASYRARKKELEQEEERIAEAEKLVEEKENSSQNIE